MFKIICIFVIALSGCVAGGSTIAETATAAKSPTQTRQSLALNSQKLGSIIAIRAEQVSTYQNLKLRLVSVEDSRCATGVACIWAGQLVVTLDVSNERAEQIEVKLIRKREPEIAKAFGYNLLLLDVEPHPKKGKAIQISDQVIKLKIVKTT